VQQSKTNAKRKKLNANFFSSTEQSERSRIISMHRLRASARENVWIRTPAAIINHHLIHFEIAPPQISKRGGEPGFEAVLI
jgi:hypothetical protein